MYRKILVPLDGSEMAEKALDHAEKLAETFDAEIILLQVLQPFYGAPEPMMPFVFDEKQRKTAERYLMTCAEDLKKRGLKVSWKVKTNLQIAAEIIDFAKESGVDLIVMSTHGRSGITLWVLGSVAHKVLTYAETPVLLIRSKK